MREGSVASMISFVPLPGYAACLSRRAIILGIAFFLCGLPEGNAQSPVLTLTPDSTFIVEPASKHPQTDRAAKLLQTWLRKASRSEKGFAIVSPSKDKPDHQGVVIQFEVGLQGTGDTLSADGFILKREGNCIRIAGSSPDGVFYGAVELLRRLGVKFYLPGVLFTSLPRNPELTIQDMDIVSEPFVESLYFSGIDSDDRPAADWARINAVWRRKGGTHQHNSFEMFPPEKFASRYEEIYPILDGKRYIPQGARDQSWQLNYLEPGLIDAAMESITAFFEKNPGNTYVALSIQDGSRFDESPATKTVIEEFREKGLPSHRNRATSHIYWNFIAEVGRRMEMRWPGKLIVALAYGGTRFPPAEKLPDNVVPFTNFHIAEMPMDGFMREGHADGRPTLEAWLKVAKHYGNHDWYQGSGYLMPRIYTKFWVEFLRTVQARLPGAFMHVETYPNWGFDGPKYYILSRLMWDPKQDADEILKVMCEDLFGPAAEGMNAYFNKLEDLWIELNCNEGIERKMFSWQSQFKTTPKSRQLIAEARSLVDQAQVLALDKDEKTRIQLFSDCLQASEYFFQLAASTSVDDAKLNEAVLFCEKLVEGHRRMALFHPHQIVPAIRELASFVRRSTKSAVKIPIVSAPSFSFDPEDPFWGKALDQPAFLLSSGTADPQRTSMKIARDSKCLYVMVRCPTAAPRSYLETDDSDWRSDNVEFKFDFNEDWNSIEEQFWVKTNGRVVDWSGRDEVASLAPEARVSKSGQGSIVVVRIPLAYISRKSPDLKNVGLQVMRNEFKSAPGASPQLDYQAIWSRRFSLAL